jgi:PAS domain S-box-containing protein
MDSPRISPLPPLDPVACLAALDPADTAILITDRDGVILWVNNVFTRITGYSPTEVIGKTPSILRSGIHDNSLFQDLWETLLAGLSWRGELINRRKDGSLYCEEQSITPVAGSDGRVTAFIAIKRDVSKQKAIEQELRQSQLFKQAVLDAIPAHIAVLDATSQIILVNKAWERFAIENGDSALAFTGVGMNYLRVCRDAARGPGEEDGSAAAAGEGIEAVLQGRQPLFRLEYPCHSPTEERWFYMRTVPLAPAGSGAVVAHLNITEIKQAEQQIRKSQRLESLGRLAGGIAHDFNNLLAVIDGYSHLIQEKLREEDPFRSDIQRIIDAGSQAVNLTRQLLAFSRNQVIQVKPINLTAVVRDCENMLRRVLREDVGLATTLDPGLGLVMADLSQMQQVLMNLVVNARDAMPRGGLLQIEAGNAEIEKPFAAYGSQIAPGSYVMLRVRDTGIGMDTPTSERIFEPFFTTKAAGSGTGLGLSTVFGIVKQAGGWIQVESEPGKGSTFSVYFPRTNAELAVEPVAKLEKACGSETILVVEDQAALRRLICDVLGQRGFLVLEAKDGKQAIEMAAARKESIHLIVTDVIMPVLSGDRMVDEILAARPETRVLFVSGYADERIADRVSRSSHTGFLPKPFTPDQLIGKVREVLGAGAVSASGTV